MSTWPAREAVTQPYWWPLPPLAGSPAPLEALVEGQVVETPQGVFFRRRAVFPLDHCYGDCALGDFLAVSPQATAALARTPELADVPLERALFLDTETTGLAGGTGTYAFMVGLGYFILHEGAPRFVLDQCFMRSFAEERAMLGWIAGHLKQFMTLVTFNGKTFDVPLLQTRFAMSRQRVDLDDYLHFDVLHPARRLWRATVASCALQSLEQHVLRVGRQEDIESFLIPAIYFQYLRDGDGRYLQRVFNHNQADILALLAIATRACLALDLEPVPSSTGTMQGEGAESARSDPVPGSRQARRPELSAAEQVGLGRIYEQLGNLTAAERAYQAALGGSLARDVYARTTMALAAVYKRQKRFDAAAVLWQSLADSLPAHSVGALVELAKYWEHRRGDPARAIELARLARKRWQAHLPAQERTIPGLSGWAEVQNAASPPDDFTRRLTRLQAKQDRQPPAGP